MCVFKLSNKRVFFLSPVICRVSFSFTKTPIFSKISKILTDVCKQWFYAWKWCQCASKRSNKFIPFVWNQRLPRLQFFTFQQLQISIFKSTSSSQLNLIFFIRMNKLKWIFSSNIFPLVRTKDAFFAFFRFLSINNI